MKKWAFLLCSILLVLCCAGLVACDKHPSDDTPAETDLFWKAPNYSQVVYVVKANALTAQELEMVVSLQGIVAQTSATIYIDYDSDSAMWLKQLTELYGVHVQYADNCWQLVETFRNYIKDDKYVLYSSTHDKMPHR